MNFPLSSTSLKPAFFSYRSPAVSLSMLKVCSLWLFSAMSPHMKRTGIINPYAPRFACFSIQ